MANTKSAIKTNRRTLRQTLVNKSRKSRYKSAIKKTIVIPVYKKKLNNNDFKSNI